ncbi:N-acetyltransferase family protein [Streptomyces sp. P6-2-1]|uniref:GNAT family N-acetyltransferase n=1 Tax=unclassified Streptomyces TaxID=2593676 RepID=UPI003D359CEC
MSGTAGPTFTVATPADTARVLGVLDEAAAWLAGRGIEQWPPRFAPEWFAGRIARGETWLVSRRDDVLGTVTLDFADPLWADSPARAAYVHSLAVRRSAAGLGAHILDWAAATARARGLDALRLDCVRSNARLRAYYEGRGFAHSGDVPVRAAPGGRTDEGPVTWMSRYALHLAPPPTPSAPARGPAHRASR